VAIYAGASVDVGLPQSVIGSFLDLAAYAKGNMPAIAAAGSLGAPVTVHMTVGAGDTDIEINGTPTASEVRLEIGSLVYLGQKSHFLNRTVQRLIERWMEEGKASQ
jgi:hypothetical protein